MSLAFTIFHAVQASLSCYTGLYSAMAIYNLQKREEQTERAAQYSRTAENQLHKTRTTQTSGALATVSSLVSGVILAALQDSGRSKIPLLLSTANTVGMVFAYNHISNFWKHKAKIPLISDYNDGITASNRMRQALGLLAVSWGGATVVYIWQAMFGL